MTDDFKKKLDYYMGKRSLWFRIRQWWAGWKLADRAPCYICAQTNLRHPYHQSSAEIIGDGKVVLTEQTLSMSNMHDLYYRFGPELHIERQKGDWQDFYPKGQLGNMRGESLKLGGCKE